MANMKVAGEVVVYSTDCQ